MMKNLQYCTSPEYYNFEWLTKCKAGGDAVSNKDCEHPLLAVLENCGEICETSKHVSDHLFLFVF